uniref:(California timema) hypothetical protein n=1 Tax=Timema californicum TaxID=61474 RepID=A0A7R9JIH8_TIMCA|nr:unnamed protein product [Timema californicum]
MSAGEFVSDDVPFSCCSTETMRHCIHYKMLTTNAIYRYEPQRHISVSQIGCYSAIITATRKLLKKIIYVLGVFALFQNHGQPVVGEEVKYQYNAFQATRSSGYWWFVLELRRVMLRLYLPQQLLTSLMSRAVQTALSVGSMEESEERFMSWIFGRSPMTKGTVEDVSDSEQSPLLEEETEKTEEEE